VNRDVCAKLLAHEVTRVFHDRLISDSDRETFHGFLAEMLHDYFKVTFNYFRLQLVVFSKLHKLMAIAHCLAYVIEMLRSGVP